MLQRRIRIQRVWQGNSQKCRGRICSRSCSLTNPDEVRNTIYTVHPINVWFSSNSIAKFKNLEFSKNHNKSNFEFLPKSTHPKISTLQNERKRLYRPISYTIMGMKHKLLKDVKISKFQKFSKN